MKALVLLMTTLFSLNSLASARHLSCFDLAGGPDHGYLVEFNSNLTRARLSAQSIAGPRDLAVLDCVRSNAAPPEGADQPTLVVSCYQRNIVDAGFALELMSGGFTGGLAATLSEQSFVGPKWVANLSCQ